MPCLLTHPATMYVNGACVPQSAHPSALIMMMVVVVAAMIMMGTTIMTSFTCCKYLTSDDPEQHRRLVRDAGLLMLGCSMVFYQSKYPLLFPACHQLWLCSFTVSATT